MKKCLLDSSFLIDLLNEMAAEKAGPALGWLRRNAVAQLWITPVTMAEVLEGAEDPDAVRTYLARFSWQGIHRVHADKVAVRQRRASHRLGENDAWQVAIAEQMGAVLVGHDSAAFERLGAAGYDDFRRAVSRA
jgi:predicted nucleic acid-binding protein